MYTSFFRLKEKPFEITPDPAFLYLGENHKEALAHLNYALLGRKGFTVITGEVGTGKTTLIQALLGKLDGHTKAAYVFNPKMGPTDFLHYICEDFGLGGLKRSKGQYLTLLHNFLMACYARKENVVLIIDEAQNLDPVLLEEVRLLTNLETPKSKLLQVILMGQPELNGILNRPQFRQLKQRVSLRYHITPLRKEEMREYINLRLRRAGAVDTALFTSRALDEIYTYTKGIPRSINIVCDNALLSGYATDQKIVGHRIIQEVINNLEGLELRGRSRLVVPILVAFLVLLCIALALFWWGIDPFSAVRAGGTGWIDDFREMIRNVYQGVLERISRILP